MIVTEEKAKTKWCPKSMDIYREEKATGTRTTEIHMASGNRGLASLEACKCITDRCMAWEEASRETKIVTRCCESSSSKIIQPQGLKPRGYEDSDHDTIHCDGCKKPIPFTHTKDKEVVTGYCGLGGKQ